MFDVGFWELLVVGVVGLVVIGPERLPGVVRVTGFWLGKARRTIATVKQEIKDELYAEELRRSLTKNSPAAEIRSLIDETAETFKDGSRVKPHERPARKKSDLDNEPADSD